MIIITDQDLLDTVFERLKQFDNYNDRLEFINRLIEDYCKECGVYCPNYSCQCWNDE